MIGRHRPSDDLAFNGEEPLELLAQPPEEVHPPSHTIHLVDHDSEVLLFLFDLLSEAGFGVSASSNAGDALEHVVRRHPEILIADMELPDVTGQEFLLRVRSLAPGTRVISTSVRAEPGDVDRVLRSGGSDLIVKPIDGARLLRVLERLLAM